MSRAFGSRWTWVALAALGLGLQAGPAVAIEFFDGKVQVHGFYESRLSYGWEDFNPANEITMYGFLHVLNIEIESELAPNGWGPFDMVAAYSSIEVKYDCVWNHACGLIDNYSTFGNAPHNMPARVQNSTRLALAGSQNPDESRRPFWFSKRQELSGNLFADVRSGLRKAKGEPFGETQAGLFGASPGPDTILGDFIDIRHEKNVVAQGQPGFLYDGNFTNPFTQLPGDDDAGTYMFNRSQHCAVGNWKMKAANQRDYSNRMLLCGIDGCHAKQTGFQRHIANPFAAQVVDPGQAKQPMDSNPVLLAILGPGNGVPVDTALPLRPGSEVGIDEKGPNWKSQGLWAPNLKTREYIKGGRFDRADQSFTLNELQWNHGASQQATKDFNELRELYMEFEAFESRLWVRAGKQTIVWGKTELFRNQDQFNPVDIAIGPLASLEESRIALCALRGIWSFYEVGPFEDVRLELAAIYDRFQPTDIGRCGEPYVPLLACTKSYGLWVHGNTGVGTGIAGENRPPVPWEGIEGIQPGVRLEFRYDRFSFALTDYWGFNQTANAVLLFQYDRNVDPNTGRPRHTEVRGSCTTGNPTLEPACLAPGHAPLNPNPGKKETGDVIEIHSINQALFAVICAGTVGVAPTVDPSACAFTLFNSTQPFPLGGTFASTFSGILAANNPGVFAYSAIIGDFPGPSKIQTNPGDPSAASLFSQFGPGGTLTNGTLDPATSVASQGSPLVRPLQAGGAAGMSLRYTVQQQALFGCGSFYLTNCDVQGVDLANTAADVVLQSFPWFEGTYFNPNWDTFDNNLPQPGTFDAFVQGYGADIPTKPKTHGGFKPGDVTTGSVGARYEDDNGVNDDGDKKKKDLFILPGARVDREAFETFVAPSLAGATLDRYIQRNLAQWDPIIDGRVCPAGATDPTTCSRQPFTGQIFSSEMAVASWDLLMLTVGLGATEVPASGVPGLGTLDRDNPFALGRCSYRQPQYCAFVSGLAAQARNTRSDVRAGGDGRFGRRNFVWASVGDLQLKYQKRNIVGFAMDFAEDTTKSSWGVEFTWVPNTLAADQDSFSGLNKVQEFNLTISADRPTFINFLNANRTFFINSQLFMNYLSNYSSSMLREGPFTALLLLNANTGYFQDRFLVSAAGVYDFTTQSAAFLPSIQYRFTENFSVTVGAAVLAGGWTRKDMGVNQFSATSDTNLNDNIYVQNGISPVRDLDNFFLRLRYTF